jgi:signal peptidase I
MKAVWFRLTALAAVYAALAGCGGSGGGPRADIETLRLPTPNMVPTFKVGTVVKADRAAYRSHGPQRGDIVILYPPSGATRGACGNEAEPGDGHPCEAPTLTTDHTVKFIQRVTGMPGEWLYVEGNRTFVATARAGPYRMLEEPFIASDTPCDDLCNLRKPVHILPDHYFVMGDNRGESNDSRNWGPAPLNSVLAKVVD